MNWLNNLEQAVDRLLPPQQGQVQHDGYDESTNNDVSDEDVIESSRELGPEAPLEQDDVMDNNNNNIMVDPFLDDVVPFAGDMPLPGPQQMRNSLSRLAQNLSSRIPQLPSSRPQTLVFYNKSTSNQKLNGSFEEDEFDMSIPPPKRDPNVTAIKPETTLLSSASASASSVSYEIPAELRASTPAVLGGAHLKQNLKIPSEQSTGDATTEQPHDEGDQSQAAIETMGPVIDQLVVAEMDSSQDENDQLESMHIEQYHQHEHPIGDIDGTDADADSAMPPLHIETTLENDEEDTSDLQVSFPLEEWNPPSTPFDVSLNKLGVVHVRILAAQRLPCPVGSSVQAIVALSPWKGRVRSESSTTFGSNNGVSARWDPLHDDEATGCAMVHAWNSRDTPIPSIQLDLMYKPISMLEFSMASLVLTCEPLMRHPGEWKKLWCQAETTTNAEDSEKNTPLILLEAAFFPAEDDDTILEDATRETFKGKNPSVFNPTFNLDRADLHDESLDGSRHSLPTRGTTGSLSYMLTSKTKPHLLRVQSYWVPANCSVCSKSIMGWKRAYRCEVCSIDCCADCQLQIDLQIPCGSTQAKLVVKASIQSKMTISSMLATIAPVDESYDVKKSARKLAQSNSRMTFKKGDIVSHFEGRGEHRNPESTQKGIGVVKINIHHARLFAEPLPPDSDPTVVFEQESGRVLRQEDLYVRVTPKGKDEKSVRTKLVQKSGAPIFDSDEFVLNVADYAMEYRIELVDASSEKPVGTTLLTAQTLLQLQRDEMIAVKGISAFVQGFRNPMRYAKQRRLALELRTGLKSGFGSDYFIPAKTKAATGESKAGEISGWISIDACLEENTDALFGPSPVRCPPRSPDELNTDLFQAHIGRIANIFRDIKKGIDGYIYVVSWKDPLLTAFSFVVFVIVTLRFNTEYVGSLPVFFLICYMLYLAYVRKTGHLKDRFIEREKESRIQAEKDATVNYSLHRPLGRVEVSIRRGKNLRSRDLGLAGSVGCHVIWDPTRYTKSEEIKTHLISVDKVLKASHAIGDTNYTFTSNPVWTQMIPSDETKRLHQLLPSEGQYFALEYEETVGLQKKKKHLGMSIEFPIPQPMKATDIKEDSDSKDGSNRQSYVLEPWSICPGAIVVQVRMSDVMTKLRLDDVLGEISIPISKIAENGEIKGWFQVLDPGSTHVLPVGGTEDGEVADNDAPLVYLHFKWNCPDSSSTIDDTDREASIVVTEELIRTAAKTAASKIDLIGSSIGAFNTMRGLTGNIAAIQNTLGTVLDIVEGLRNSFNFTVCQKMLPRLIRYLSHPNTLPCTAFPLHRIPTNRP